MAAQEFSRGSQKYFLQFFYKVKSCLAKDLAKCPGLAWQLTLKARVETLCQRGFDLWKSLLLVEERCGAADWRLEVVDTRFGLSFRPLV